MYVGQATIVSEWFINFELPLAIAMISCIPLFGSLLNGYVTPKVYQHHAAQLEPFHRGKAFGVANLVGFFMQVGSLVMVMVICYLDYKTEKKDEMLLR